jgi:hypothetical protein
MTAAALDRERLTKLLGMLGSEHDGEALAAARQAERLRAEAGVLARRSVLTQWEVGFVESVRGARYSLSSRQRALLHRLVEKAAAAARAA